MPDPRRHRLKTILGIAASVAIASLALYVLYRTFQRISFADVLANIRAVPRERLLLAAVSAVFAFATLAAYEVVVVRYVKHCIGRAKPVITSLIAFPLGHALGQTLLSGSAVRYRMYAPAGFSATEVGATVLLCGMPYVLAFGLLIDFALVFASEQLAPLFRIPAQWLFALGCVGLLKDAAYLVFVYRRKAPIRLGGWSVRMPTLRLTLLQIVVGIVDICLVASVLYLLLPAAAGIAFLPFLAIYLASILVGVLSHVPAGLGVLESMLLLLLSHVPPEQLLAAVLIYRVIYEVIPVGVALALWGGYELTAADGARLRLLRPAPAEPPPPAP
jgi:glycosyltransferase 2 family protein